MKKLFSWITAAAFTSFYVLLYYRFRSSKTNHLPMPLNEKFVNIVPHTVFTWRNMENVMSTISRRKKTQRITKNKSGDSSHQALTSFFFFFFQKFLSHIFGIIIFQISMWEIARQKYVFWKYDKMLKIEISSNLKRIKISWFFLLWISVKLFSGIIFPCYFLKEIFKNYIFWKFVVKIAETINLVNAWWQDFPDFFRLTFFFPAR